LSYYPKPAFILLSLIWALNISRVYLLLKLDIVLSNCLFSSPDPKGHVSYCYHLSSSYVVNFFKNLLLHVRFLIILTFFELLPKTCNFTISSIFSNSGHVGWCTASPDTLLKLETLFLPVIFLLPVCRRAGVS
jgi:hypothetical protein